MILSLSVFLLCGCDGKEAGQQDAGASAEPGASPLVTVEPSETPSGTPGEAEDEPEESWYDAMLEASILYKGNNERLKMVLDKAKAGEDVYIAAIGGSVTEGANETGDYKKGYIYRFRDAFIEKYAGGDSSIVHFMNAGLSGTPSSLGVLRYEQDVTEELGHVPDLLFIEFSINDYMECTNGKGFEGLVLKALTENEDCAVIPVFAVSKSKWNMQDNYVSFCKNLMLPMVSIKDAIVQPFADGNLTDKLFFMDDYHPTTYGHQVMCDCIMHLLETADKSEYNRHMDVAKRMESLHPGYVTTRMIGLSSAEKDENLTLSAGSFGTTDTVAQQLSFAGRSSFPDNFCHTEGTEPLKLTLSCSKLLFAYKAAGDASFGRAEVYVDGVLFGTYDGYTQGGWNNPQLLLLIDEKEAAEHTIEVRMAAGEENKKFTVYAFSYAKD